MTISRRLPRQPDPSVPRNRHFVCYGRPVMTLRYSLLLGTALLTVAGAANAQQTVARRPARRSDAPHPDLRRDHRFTSRGWLLRQGAERCRQRAGARADAARQQSAAALTASLSRRHRRLRRRVQSSGGQVGQQQLAPPPLDGAGRRPGDARQQCALVLHLCAAPEPSGPTPLAPPQANDPDAAFNPRGANTAYQPEAPMPRPQPPLRRTGPRPVPNYSSQHAGGDACR